MVNIGKPLLSKIRAVALILITVAIIYFIIIKIANRWNEFKILLISANPWGLVFAFITFWICTLIPILIWKKFLKSLYNIDIALQLAFCAVVISNAARYIPGKIWFILLVAYLGEQFNLGKGKLITVSIWFQISNLLASFIVGMTLLPTQNYITNVVTIIVVALSIYFLLKPELINIVISKLTKEKSEFSKKNIGASLYGFALNILCWLLYGFSTYLVAKSLSSDLNIHYISSITGASSITYFLGYIALLAPAGLGIRDGLLVIMLPHTLNEPTRITVAVGDRILYTLAETVNIIVAIFIIKFVYKSHLTETGNLTN